MSAPSDAEAVEAATRFARETESLEVRDSLVFPARAYACTVVRLVGRGALGGDAAFRMVVPHSPETRVLALPYRPVSNDPYRRSLAAIDGARLVDASGAYTDSYLRLYGNPVGGGVGVVEDALRLVDHREIPEERLLPAVEFLEDLAAGTPAEWLLRRLVKAPA